LAALLCAASGIKAQPLPQAAPAAAAPAQADPMKFSDDHVMVLYQVKPDKTADFEAGISALKDKLSKAKPELKPVADSVNVFKVQGAASATSVVYLFEVNPVVKGQSYDLVQLIYYSTAFPERPEADALYKKIGDSLFAPGVNIWPLKKVG